MDIDIPGMILNVRAEAMKKNKSPILYSLLTNFEDIAKWSSKTSEIANALSDNELIRNVAEKFVGVSSKRKMPEFQKLTFEKWFENRMKKRSRV
jgi:hypothetical protein